MPIKRRKPGQSSGRRVRRGFGTQALATAAGRVGAYAVRGVAKRVGRFARRRFAGPAKGSANKPRMAGKQYARSKVKQGRRLPKRRLGEIVVGQNMQSNVFFYKSLDTDFDGDQGRNVLSKVTAAANAAVYWPVYMYNLTAIGQGTVAVTPFWRMYSTNTNSVRWISRNGQDALGISNNSLQSRNIGGIGGGVISEKSYLDWARMRFTLYGAKNRPMTIRIRIVKILDESLQPENAAQTLATPNENQKNAAWFSYMKSLVAHPIAGGSTVVLNKNLQIISTKTYTFNPSNTTDSDPDPEHRTVDWFKRLGMRIDYRGTTQAINYLSNGSIVDGGVQATDANQTAISGYPSKAKDNLYVLIDCNNYGATPIVVGADGQAGSPDVASADAASFDMHFELCHKTLDTV